MQGHTGTSLGGRIIESPRRRKRRRRARARQEARWARLSGPVTTYVDESVRRQADDTNDAKAVSP